MSEAERLARVRRWLRHAEQDLAVAELFLHSSVATPHHVCFWAQQTAEKALKAVLVFEERPILFIHDLDALRELLPEGWRTKDEHPDLAELTQWAVAAFYPADWPDPTPDDAGAALRQARAVWESVLRDFERHGFSSQERP